MTSRLDYERDGASIYERSFASIRSELGPQLSELGDLEAVAVRMVHAAGDTSIVGDLEAGAGLVAAARAALRRACPIYCDSEMVARGITRRRLPAGNDVRCTLHAPGVAGRAASAATTRSAAAVEDWLPELDGAVAVIGNAPTALFRLLELVLDGVARPAAIVGVPVGFVGAVESKRALTDLHHGIPYLTLHGRRGGSAIAAAAVNALATEEEILR